MTITNGALASGDQLVIENFNLAQAENHLGTGFLGIHFNSQLAVEAGGTNDPFVTGDFGSVNTSVAAQGDAQGMTIFVSAVSDQPQTVTLALAGADASQFKLDTGTGVLDFSNGSVKLTIPAGQDNIMVGLVYLGDPSQKPAVQLTSTLVDANGAAESSSASNTLSITYNGTSNADPKNTTALTGTDGPFWGNDPTSPPINSTFFTLDGTNDLVQANGKPILVAPGSGANAGSGDNNIAGSSANDFVTAGNGNNLIVGNGGHDLLSAGDGNNKLYANTEVDLETALTQSKNSTATGQQGSLLAVGDGNNTLVGGNGNDLILTGSGNNTIVLGAGTNFVVNGVVSNAHEIPVDNTSNWGINPTSDSWIKGVNLANKETGVTFQGEGSAMTAATSEATSLYLEPAASPGTTPTIPISGIGNDTIYAGSGNNFMMLSNGDNYVDASRGNDWIYSGLGNSTVFGGSGTLTMRGGAGDDNVVAGSGNALIVGQGGNNNIIGGSGNDTIFAGAYGDPWASGETGNNYVESGDGASVVYGSGGNDTLIGGAGQETLRGGAGNENMQAGSGANLLIGGTGKDTLLGGAGNDTLQAGDGDTTIYGGTGVDSIWGGKGNNVLYAGDGGQGTNYTQVVAGKGDTTIHGGAGVDVLFGGDGKDVIYVGDGGGNGYYSEAHAGSGDTTIYGGAGVDHIFGGAGTNVLYAGDGGNASMSTQVSAGAGNTTIYGGAGIDNLVGGAGADMIYAGDGGTADNATSVTGGSGNDTLVSGAGTDAFFGGSGPTTYQINNASGSLSITNSGAGDTLQFGAGIGIADITATQGTYADGTTGVILKLNGGGSVTIAPGGLSTATFADGAVASLSQLLSPQFTLGNTTYSSVNGTLANTTSSSPATQNLTLSGTADVSGTGNNVNDVITANAGNDTLIAGTANDTLIGGGASAQYVVSAGAGTVTTINKSSSADTLSFAAGVSLANLSASTAAAADGSLIVTLQNNQGGSVIINGGKSSGASGGANSTLLDQISFADGSSGSLSTLLAQATTGITAATSATSVTLPNGIQNMTLTGSADLTATGNALPDVITANSGNDTLIAGTANDTLVGGSGNDTFIAGSGATTMIGGTGNTVIAGGSGSDVMVAGSGNATLTGGTGNATFVFNQGFGQTTIADSQGLDTLQFGSGIAASDLAVSFNSNDDVVIADGSSVLTIARGAVSNMTAVNFADGSSATLDQLTAAAVPVSGVGVHPGTGNTRGGGNDTISKMGGHQILLAGSGNESLIGGGGYDLLVGGPGNDTLAALDGNDSLVGGTGYTVMHGGHGADTYMLTQGATAEIGNDNVSGAQAIWLPHGMSFADFTPVQVGTDLYLNSQSGDTTAIVKNFFSPNGQPAQWMLLAENDQPQSLSSWVAASQASSTYNDQIDTLRAAFGNALGADLKKRGTAGESLGTLPDLRIGQQFGNANSTDYTFGGVKSVDLSADGNTTLTSSESEQSSISQTNTTVTTTLPVYKEVQGNASADYTFTIHLPPGTSGVPLPPGASVVDMPPKTDQNGNVVFNPDVVIDVPGTATYHRVQTGVVTQTQTIATNTATVGRNFTIQNVTGTNDDISINVAAATGQDVNGPYSSAFRGTVVTGDGNDYVNLGTSSNTAPDWASFDATPGLWLPPNLNLGLGLGAFIQGGNGNDTLIGTDASDVISAGTGFNFIDGGNGGDTYYVNLQGDATDVINDTGSPDPLAVMYGGKLTSDTLVLPPGVTLDNLSCSLFTDPQYPGSQVLQLNYGTANVLIVYPDTIGPNDTASNAGVEQFQFADGKTLTRGDLLKLATVVQNPFTTTVTSADPILNVGQPVAASSLFTATDSSGNAVTWYKISGMNGGWLSGSDFKPAVGNTQLVSAAQLQNLQFTSAGFHANFSVSAFNGEVWSKPATVNLTKISGSWSKADGSTGSDTFNADGTSSSIVNDGKNDVTTTNFDAKGNKISDSWSKADGSTGSDTFNANGTSSSIVNDGKNDVTTTNFYANGNKISDSWGKADGSTGSDTFNADGTSRSIVNDGKNDVTTTNFDANGNKISDSWSKVDGSTGSDTYNANGSSSGTTLNADGTSSNYADGVRGNIFTTTFDVRGKEISDSWTTSDGSHGTDAFGTDGSMISDSWTNSDGSHGTDAFSTDGSSTGISYNSDGSYYTYTQDASGNNYAELDFAADGSATGSYDWTLDAQGNSLDVYYDANGIKLSSDWGHADGSHGEDIFNIDGSSGGTSYRSDGSLATDYTNDGQGDITTNNYSPTGVLTGQTVVADHAHNNVTLGDGTDSVTVGSGGSSIVVGNGDDLVTLGSGTNNVTLGSGIDRVVLGNGTDTLQLGGGVDTVVIGIPAGDLSNTGQATVVASPAGTSELLFANANSDQLWFQRSGNDLDIGVIGTSFQLDVSGWYGSSSNHVQSIVAADGKTLTDGNVDALVSAMASFNPPASGATVLPDTYQSQLQPVIAANWH
ncbi:hypothetical protein [Collimonas sp.]|uniref:hypothetical protein n=1 Tax=Collimonas sp. TaxID=1963772 RepID=UPI002C6620AF|nr:hypothetical protein [Collimonas sp.]HWW04230.1 hypothetical protein [Collimonas sp.]